jgi:alpha-beta hydrolase superfamily lysophospholipase
MIGLARHMLGLREEELFRHEPEREAYRSDPLVHRRISARLWGEMQRNAASFAARAPQMRAPVLFQLPGDDRVVSSVASIRIGERMTGDVEVREYAHAYHALFHDPLAEDALADLSDWLQRHA